VRAIVRVCAYAEQRQARRLRAPRAFTLIDILVSMAVISVLIGLMLPALTAIRETTRKVVCSSNIRQIGLSTAMYADDYKGQLPHSRFYEKSLYTSIESIASSDLMRARIAEFNDWDGLGLLYGKQYCSAAQVFYCPSHKSVHRYERYSTGWRGGPYDVYTNFQYRGGSVDKKSNLSSMPDRISLMADGMASTFDFNHGVGGNVVASDMSVAWFEGTSSALDLPFGYDDPAAKAKLQQAWLAIDDALFK